MQKAVAILLAVYDPPQTWFAELLDSLNRQTYQNITLYVRDDASPTVPLATVEQMLAEHITEFSYFLYQNDVNMGSNKTFAALVEDAQNEDYVMFCDQDDVWLPQKVENTVHLYENSPLSPTVVCTELTVTDGDGKIKSPLMSQHRRRHVFLRGEGVAPSLIYRNFCVGCTMLLSRERAKSYLPYPDEVVHDHYLAFRAACDGAVDFLEEPQILYREYGGNQTGVMTKVDSKEDYYNRRIEVFAGRAAAFAARIPDLPELQSAVAWCEARRLNFKRKKGGMRALWKTRRQNPVTSYFELLAPRMPNWLFRMAIRMIQKGQI